jgi:hypothetical protein
MLYASPQLVYALIFQSPMCESQIIRDSFIDFPEIKLLRTQPVGQLEHGMVSRRRRDFGLVQPSPSASVKAVEVLGASMVLPSPVDAPRKKMTANMAVVLKKFI